MEPSSPLEKLIQSHVVRYPESSDLRLLTFSFLEGCDLFHKIALTSKSIRDQLSNSGILDQIKEITIKLPSEMYHDDFPV